MSVNLTQTEVVTGEVRLSYCNVFTARAPLSGGDPKFSATILIPKSDTATLQRIQSAIEAATQNGISKKWNGQRPPVIPNPLHDGDGVRPSDGAEFGPECKGHWVITASANQDRPPQVVDAQRNPIINQAMVYSGVYAHVYINFYPYFAAGKKGIGCGLNAIQKTRDGEALGGVAKDANDVFGVVAQVQQTDIPGQMPLQAPYPGQQGQYQAPQAPYPTSQATMPHGMPTQIDPITGQPIVPNMGY